MNGHEKLAVAILQQAAKEYQTALKRRDTDKITYFENWFVGEWAQLLSHDTGEIIIRKCQERVQKKTRFNRMGNVADYPIRREVLDRG